MTSQNFGLPGTALPPADTQASTSILTRAANPTPAEHPPGGQAVTAALLDAEKESKQPHQCLSPASLLGTWQLRFIAPQKPAYKNGQRTSGGFYIPGIARATISFQPDADPCTGLKIQNQLQVGPLRLRFSGPAKLMAKKNLLAFDFIHLQCLIGPWTLLSLPVRGGSSKYSTFETAPIGKLPFFAFFAATDTYIAARGRGGGLALWARTNNNPA